MKDIYHLKQQDEIPRQGEVNALQLHRINL